MLNDQIPIVNYQKTNPVTLLKLTEKLIAEQYFDAYLTPNQLVILEKVLTIDDKEEKLKIWNSLLDANIILTVETVDHDDVNDEVNSIESNDAITENVTGDAENIEEETEEVKEAQENKETENEETQNEEIQNGEISSEENQNGKNKDSNENDDLSKLDLEDFTQQIKGSEFIGNLSLKLRYVLWQCAIDLMYNSSTELEDQLDDEDNDVFDYILLENDNDLRENVTDNKTAEFSEHRQNMVKELDEYHDKDDDYDDDDYDIDNDNDSNNSKKNEEEESSNDLPEISFGFNESEIPELNIKVSKKFLKNIRTNNIEKIIHNWDKIYHSFEHDQDTMLKRLRLEENDKLLENSKVKKRSHEQISDKDDIEQGDNDNTKKLLNGAETDNDKVENSPHDSKKPRYEALNLPVGLGAANLSLKYLMASIRENQSKLNMTDYELKHLITDVRKNRSKWSSDERIGQEELYEACEKVAMELRNHTEHSTPFLNKVSKREAPNYHQVIKKSMDLNTVLKKLKAFQYNSKQEFVDDIMLIWKNCLTYNSDPSHFLRSHAIAMQKKSLQLIPLIPDITIRNRADVERELENIDKDKDNDDDYEEEDDAAGSGRKGLTMGAHMPATSKAAEEENTISEENAKTDGTSNNDTKSNDIVTTSTTDSKSITDKKEAIESTPKEESKNFIPTSTGEPLSTEAHEDIGGEDKLTRKDGSRLGEEQEVDEEVEDDEDEDDDLTNHDSRSYIVERDDDKDDIEISLWKSLTAKLRSNLCIKRAEYFKNGKLNKDTPAFLKNPKKMQTFENTYKEFIIQKNEELNRKQKEQQSIMKNGFGALLKQENEEEIATANNEDLNEDIIENELNNYEIDNISFLKEYNVTNAVPDLQFQGVSSKKLDREENAIIQNLLNGTSKKSSRFVENINKGMSKQINQNISLIQQIRHVCHKISLIRLLQISAYNQNKSSTQETLNSHVYKTVSIDDTFDLDPVSQLDTHDFRLNRDAIKSIMHKSVSKISMANGFESSQPSAANMFTEVAEDYLSNLLKSMKVHKESNTLNYKTDNEILQMTLLDNGVSRPDDLYVYVDAEFTKKKKKLIDLKTKLESFLKELLRPTLQELSERTFDDQSQSFVTGDFASEITGEDFFGFKDLGLEKEFGVLSSSVPLQLLTFQFNSSSAEAAVKIKMVQPEEFDYHYKKITKDGIESGTYPKLLIPLLKNSHERTIEFHQKLSKLNNNTNEESIEPPADHPAGLIMEDDKMILKNKPGSKVRVPPTGKLNTTYKKKTVAGGYFLPETNDIELSNVVLDTKIPLTLDNSNIVVNDLPKSSKDLSEYSSARDNDASALEKLFETEDEPVSSLQ